MLDGILGRGFSVKCKSLIKATQVRIDVVRRRADAKQRFLKEDLAQLLSNGLDINAYGRTEEFLAGMDLLCCYDFVERSCEYTINQLKRMQKQGDCPEECREAVASLMYAAARFSDLPELRGLRDIFQQRYGNCLEAFVNQKFVEKLSSRPPASEKRLLVLQDIASEFSIKWDSRAFELRMATPSVVAQVDVQKVDIVKQSPGLLEEKNSRIVYCGEDNILRRNGAGQCSFGRKETIEYMEKSVLRRGGSSLQGDGGDLSSRGRHTVTESKQSYSIEKIDAELKGERSNSSSHGKILSTSAYTGYMGPSSGIRNPRNGESKEALFREKAEFAPSCLEPLGRTENDISFNYTNQDNALNSIRNGVEDGSDRLKSCSSFALHVKSKDNIPRPPYIKPKEDKHRHSRGPTHAHIGPDRGDCEDLLVASVKVKNHDNEKGPETIPLPKPQSIRRKNHKSSTNYNLVDALEEGVRAVVSSRRKDHSRQGLQILFDEEHHRKDDEERMIDNLLIHYSKKSSSYDAGKLRKKSGHQINTDVGESSLDQSRDAGNSGVLFPYTTRSVSLRHEQQPISPQPKTVFTRANTFEPDHNQARHAHPKLPDYDDLAARFAGLKGR